MKKNSVLKGSFLLCPELASPSWTRAGGMPFIEAIEHYESSILTSLFLGKPILAPESLLDILKEMQNPKYNIQNADRIYYQQLNDFLIFLQQTNNLVFIPTSRDIEISREMMQFDIAAAKEKRIITTGGGYGWQVRIPGSDNYIWFQSSHGSTDQVQGCIANFILLAYQRYGCEFIEPVYNADFSMRDFLVVKNYLWEIQPEPAPMELANAEQVLRVFIPYTPIINWEHNQKTINYSVIKRVIQIRNEFAESLNEWQDHIDRMRDYTIHPDTSARESFSTRSFRINQILKTEMEREFKKSSIRDLTLTLLTIPVQIPIISSLISLLSTIIPNAYDYTELAKNQKRIDFYFYIQSLATIMK